MILTKKKSLIYERIDQYMTEQSEVRASQDFIHSIHNSVPIIIFIYSLAEKKISFVNDQLYTMLGYLPEEMCNVPFADLKKYIVDYESNTGNSIC
jgi:PAS domain-containing protein